MITAIMTATNPKDFFGDNEKRAGITYRRYARTIHPDINPDPRATEAFQKLNQLWDAYNNHHATTTNTTTSTAPSNVVYTATGEYKVTEDIQTDAFFTRYTTENGEQVLIVSTPDDNDLAEHHAETLQTLHTKIPEAHHGFYPKLVDQFETADNLHGIIQKIPNNFVPFTQILKRYPDGIGGRDMGWIFKRIFMTLGLAHDAGLVHGGVSLDSLYINPEEHGIILNDWQYSKHVGEILTAVPFKDGYPTKFLDKEPVTPELDLKLTASIAQKLYNDDDWRITRFFKHLSEQGSGDGAFWFKEFDWLLRQIYGKPSFHPFTLK